MLFYDFNFNLLLVEPRVISWRLTKYYNAIGTFEAHLPLSSPAAALLIQNDRLIAGIKGEYAIITGIQADDELVIYGRTCNWLLSKRVVMPSSAVEMTTGEYVIGLFGSAYTDCTDVTTGSFYDGAEHTFLREKKEFLSEVIFGALEADGLGCELVFDSKNRCWRFDILKGDELSLTISEANKNASKTTLTRDISKSARVCYFGDADDYVMHGDEADGIGRFETFVVSDSEEKAEEQLAKLERTDKTEVTSHGISYRADYHLGDSVRVQLIKGDYRETKRLRIKGVELLQRSVGYSEKPIFEEE